ncbi:hypothetical protein QQX98_011749 [Neonectria punicea]|uniref:Uncharacterized protein n=1 Tax=Neonectria punicea TaxID=979145 RepID=A0ABR1GKU7_9HYPO
MSRPRIAGNRFAQLVSRFEVLEAPSPASQHQGFDNASKSKPGPRNNSSSSTHHAPRRDGNARKQTSSGSSGISPNQSASLSVPSLQLRRSQTLKTIPSTTSSNAQGFGPRHKSVAERRRLFEADGSGAGNFEAAMF